MYLKSCIAIAMVAFIQIIDSEIVLAASDTVERLVDDRNLVNLSNYNLGNRLVQKKPKSRKPVILSPSQPSNPPSVNQSLAQPLSMRIVTEIVITTDRGQLDLGLESKIRQLLTVKTGQPTTREQLEQNLNAIRSLGAFSKVEIIPENTAKGVKISFVVTAYGNLRQVQIRTLPVNSSTVLKQTDIDSIFQSQYGKQLNAVELQAAIKKLNEFYQKQGYNLAQVVDVEELGADGTLKLVITEGSIEDVQVRFLNKKGESIDENKQPFTGLTRPFIITREAESKPGIIFNRNTIEKDLRRIYGLGLFDDVRVSFAPGKDPAKVILQLNVIERGKNTSILPSFGYSSRNGIFGNLSFGQQSVGGNNHRLNVQGQVGSENSTTFDLSFSDPWIATDPHRTAYTVNAFQQQSFSSVFDGGKTPVFVPGTTSIPRLLRQGGGVTFNRPLNGDPFSESTLRGSLGVQYQRISVNDVGGAIVPKDSGGNDLSFSGTGQDELLMVQLGVTQDRRNNFIDPTQGSLLKVGIDQSALST